jgi:hypothetical protein
MHKVLIGWNEILVSLGVDPSRVDKLPAESWDEWASRKGWEMTSKGLPVFFLPMLDNQPRCVRARAVRWAERFSEGLFIEHDLACRYEAEKAEAEAGAAEE